MVTSAGTFEPLPGTPGPGKALHSHGATPLRTPFGRARTGSTGGGYYAAAPPQQSSSLRQATTTT